MTLLSPIEALTLMGLALYGVILGCCLLIWAAMAKNIEEWLLTGRIQSIKNSRAMCHQMWRVHTVMDNFKERLPSIIGKYKCDDTHEGASIYTEHVAAFLFVLIRVFFHIKKSEHKSGHPFHISISTVEFLSVVLVKMCVWLLAAFPSCNWGRSNGRA